jgi:hypothetical protein
MPETCVRCQKHVEEWNERCGGCGYRLVLEPEEVTKRKYLRGPSLGALLWTQGWTFGARLYLLFLLSFVPIVGFVVLLVGLLLGRRLSWKYGGWEDFETFKKRMRLLDLIAGAWVVIVLIAWFVLRR